MVKTLEKWYHAPAASFGASTNKRAPNGGIARGIAYHKRVYRLLATQMLILPEDERRHTELLIEPWFRTQQWKQRSPDAVLLNRRTNVGLVIEVKLNWKDGRDTKLIDEYLPIVRSAFDLADTKPLLITQNLRGYQHPPLLGLRQLALPLLWMPGQPTPLMLVP